MKTRLATELGPGTAAALYRAMAEEVLRRTAPKAGEYERLLFFTPPRARAAVEAWLPGHELRGQSGGDLGARMAAAFAEVFRRGAARAAVIGTDAPLLGRAYVREALQALDGHDVAVGPARDGGYCLLALDRPRPALFEGVRWGTAEVLEATLGRAAALGLRVRTLDPLGDVDTLDDLREAWPALRPCLEGRPDVLGAVDRALRRP